MAKTLAVYTTGTFNEVKSLTQAKITELFNEGKTDGLPIYTADVPETGQYTVERNWVNVPSAEYWIAYCETLSILPLTQTLIND
jgi:hypothetical protein